jgi:hypothetical protein
MISLAEAEEITCCNYWDNLWDQGTIWLPWNFKTIEKERRINQLLKEFGGRKELASA